jgi:hypothetical protein
MTASMNTAAYTLSNGRAHHVVISSMTRSVMRETVSCDHARAGHVSEVGADLALGQALGRQRQHHRIQVRQAPGPFGDDHRLEGALPVPRDLDLDRPALSVITVLDRFP